ncbi:hypothetical protein HPODL_05358 [Ogataea parapolymorpha DL-1]|uniref:rRNA-processing protein FYV7 n=1 Tax=Ogataea parapolymorpha (strain ATCC 26012 / BCRC 20466 / JCM 22074 / NRRL Y-7560 / DL-1) TaxID=871575 RepID=W1Q8J9_OGAPD|nr:hypothetical protein HPODL_05358 [Ogataea parapolymorpha DL-1]ESW96377.1 hypothetical protein HPODL_05358 [Ogataea parapolymorpha DL-1]
MSKKYDRETKTRDIKKALAHRANLRRSYFKLVNQEKTQSEEPKPFKPLTYQDRIKIKQERKERSRLQKIERTRQKLQQMKEKEKQREQKTKSLKNAKTRTGQPLMAPRINDLLDKIKKEVKN